jgi:hypothetical protein
MNMNRMWNETCRHINEELLAVVPVGDIVDIINGYALSILPGSYSELKVREEYAEHIRKELHPRVRRMLRKVYNIPRAVILDTVVDTDMWGVCFKLYTKKGSRGNRLYFAEPVEVVGELPKFRTTHDGVLLDFQDKKSFNYATKLLKHHIIEEGEDQPGRFVLWS